LARSLIVAASDGSRVPAGARIEALLSALYATSVRVRAVDRLEPLSVARCHLTAQSADVPASVVVKWLRDDPDDIRSDPAQLHTEQAALEFVAELDPALTPRLLAAGTVSTDSRDRILILEDLAPREPLREALLREGPERSARMLASFARALGRLHAVSAGQADAYYSRRSRLGPVDRRADIEHFFRDWRAGAQRMADAGVVMTTAAAYEVADIVTELARPSAFLAFSSGDPGVNNYLTDAHGDGRLIDFESAGFRHAICDLINDLYIPGPMWLTVGDPLSNGVEEAYRNTLAQTVPEVTDNHWFGQAVSGAGFVFAAGRLRRLARLDARPSGDHSRLNRIAALEAAADTAERHHCLPHLTAWARTAAEDLRRRWPDADIDLKTLPDYTPRQ
jgi:Phosphotransferase enzyme family